MVPRVEATVFVDEIRIRLVVVNAGARDFLFQVRLRPAKSLQEDGLVGVAAGIVGRHTGTALGRQKGEDSQHVVFLGRSIQDILTMGVVGGINVRRGYRVEGEIFVTVVLAYRDLLGIFHFLEVGEWHL